MGREWIKQEGFKGVRFRVHPERKHGVRFDRYFSITFKWRGKTVTEAIGWESEGFSASDARDLLSMLKKNQRAGTPPFTLTEKRAMEAESLEAKRVARKQAEIESTTYGDFFLHHYSETVLKAKRQYAQKTERAYFRDWIGPIVGKKPFKMIAPVHLERIKRNLIDAGRAPRTVQAVFGAFRIVWRTAQRDGFVATDPPSKRVSLPRFDNRRMRALTREEAETLLTEVRKRSEQTYQIAVFALYAGLRAGEVFGLTWQDLDLARGILTLRDTKSGRTRQAYITQRMREVLAGKTPGKPTDLVFPDRKGKRIGQISGAFGRTVAAAGFNDGIEDRRLRVSLHTLRHSFASWLVESGVDLYQVKTLLGHSTIALTERYSHLRPDTLRAAVKVLDEHPAGAVVALDRAGKS